MIEEYDLDHAKHYLETGGLGEVIGFTDLAVKSGECPFHRTDERLFDVRLTSGIEATVYADWVNWRTDVKAYRHHEMVE